MHRCVIEKKQDLSEMKMQLKYLLLRLFERLHRNEMFLVRYLPFFFLHTSVNHANSISEDGSVHP